MDRIRRLVRAANRLADPIDELGRRARSVLPASTGLSPEGIELALTRHLETHPTEEEIRCLCSAVEPAPAVHVVLPSNVFSAAHRAVAVALAASRRVFVRPSRREPHFARLLRDAGAPFELVSELAVRGGDHVWAYGSEGSLRSLRDAFPEGAVLHGFGPGFGVALIDAMADELEPAARAVAWDVVPFDQRGCLSPVVALVQGGRARAERFARALARELADLAMQVPVGRRTAAEAADLASYRGAVRYAGNVVDAGPGVVGVARNVLMIPPPPRSVHVAYGEDAASLFGCVEPRGASVTALGANSLTGLVSVARPACPGARWSRLGDMQHPPFDGPVDLRCR